METTFEYLRHFGPALAERILATYPPLQSTKDPVAPSLEDLLRKPLPAQALAITGTAKYLRKAKAARIVAECGAGKTLMALGATHVLSEGRPSTTLVMCPSHITHKWAREVLLTIPRAHAFLIEDMRNGGDPGRPHGVCEVKLKNGKTVYEGKRLTLSDMRRMGRREWRKRFPWPTVFITGKDRGKLSYFWDHVFLKPKSGPNLGGVVNPDSGLAVLDSEMEKLTALDFRDKVKVSEVLTPAPGGATRFSALWQADRTRIQRMAPIEFVGRYMRGWFDFAIADELHQLAGDTAQGNGLGVLGRAARRLIALTGTLMGGYADDLFNIFYRMEPQAMVREGFAYGGQGRRDFQEQYGVLETIEKVEETDNACSRATKKTVRVLRKPGASPLLFGKFLMNTTAFLSLEDISDNLPRYDESVISVDMDDALQQAYEQLEEEIRSAMNAHRGNKSLMSILLNTLLLYPDHPYGFDQIWARAFDPETKEYVKFLVTEPQNLTREALYAKERALIADVKEELRQGRRCQVYATYTGEKDVTLRLEAVLRQEGIRVAVLRSSVPTDKREDWYDRQLKAGVEVVICHPKLVETGLDLLAFPTLYFYETGYSLHTLRQASRRSWRIGQRFPVRVKFVTYSGTMQETCLRLMGKKMLVALMMEGKFSGEGLQALDTDEDLMSAMARELVEKAGVGESADAAWRELDRERQKIQPRPANVEPEPEEELEPVLELPTLPAPQPVPMTFGIHLMEPPSAAKKGKKTKVWPTATEANAQLSLFD
ncbi:MAG: DEAD/DEAH box helicase [Acidobacteriota bacterium]|nr:DEAD/DEAH box helicase [Acidobacteriota bacterium]